jgi:C4-dicarboxylate transporter DctQ subunit
VVTENQHGFVAGLEHIETVFAKIFGVITSIAFIIMILFMLVQVTCRFIIKISVPWTEEFIRYLFMSVAFIGSSVAIKENSHIEINFISGIIEKKNPKTRAVLNKSIDITRFLLIFIFCTIISGMCIQFVMRMKAMGQLTPALHMPKWWLDSMVAFGFVFMSAFSLIEFIKAIFHNYLLDTLPEAQK